MASDLFRQMGSNDFLQRLNDLKSKGGDPNAMINELVKSGRVSQAQLNEAINKAQEIMQILPLGGRQ